MRVMKISILGCIVLLSSLSAHASMAPVQHKHEKQQVMNDNAEQGIKNGEYNKETNVNEHHKSRHHKRFKMPWVKCAISDTDGKSLIKEGMSHHKTNNTDKTNNIEKTHNDEQSKPYIMMSKKTCDSIQGAEIIE